MDLGALPESLDRVLGEILLLGTDNRLGAIDERRANADKYYRKLLREPENVYHRHAAVLGAWERVRFSTTPQSVVASYTILLEIAAKGLHRALRQGQVKADPQHVVFAAMGPVARYIRDLTAAQNADALGEQTRALAEYFFRGKAHATAPSVTPVVELLRALETGSWNLLDPTLVARPLVIAVDGAALGSDTSTTSKLFVVPPPGHFVEPVLGVEHPKASEKVLSLLYDLLATPFGSVDTQTNSVVALLRALNHTGTSLRLVGVDGKPHVFTRLSALFGTRSTALPVVAPATTTPAPATTTPAPATTTPAPATTVPLSPITDLFTLSDSDHKPWMRLTSFRERSETLVSVVPRDEIGPATLAMLGRLFAHTLRGKAYTDTVIGHIAFATIEAGATLTNGARVPFPVVVGATTLGRQTRPRDRVDVRWDRPEDLALVHDLGVALYACMIHVMGPARFKGRYLNRLDDIVARGAGLLFPAYVTGSANTLQAPLLGLERWAEDRPLSAVAAHGLLIDAASMKFQYTSPLLEVAEDADTKALLEASIPTLDRGMATFASDPDWKGRVVDLIL